MLEITKSSKKKIEKADWEITYRGRSIFEDYMEAFDDFENVLDIGYDYIEEVRNCGQEVYLGYIPSLDTFVTGWDLSGNVDTGVLFFQFDNGKAINITPKYGYAPHFYPGNLKRLEKEHKDIIHIRLD